MNRLRVVIDARPLSHPQPGGFKTSVRTLVRGLAELGGDHAEILLYLDRPLSSDAPPLPPHVGVRVLSPDRLRTDWLLFRRQVREDRPDLVHGTMNYVPQNLPVPTTVTIHDAMGVKPYSFVRVKRTPREVVINRYWSLLTRLSARSARRIVTDSGASASELAGALGKAPGDFAVVYHGITLPAPRPGLRRDAAGVLALASPDPRKNLVCLYRALSEERARIRNAPRLDVVCTSAVAAGRAEEALRRHGIDRFRLLCDLDDQALSDAYAQAAAFVFPSRMEGFGLPPLEAMQTGCPVLSSSAPCLPEVLGDSPLWFDPDRPDELAAGLDRLLADPGERRTRGERGRAHAAGFTCRRMAEQMLDLWRAALSPKRGEG